MRPVRPFLCISLLAIILLAGQALALETPKGKTSMDLVNEAKSEVSATSPEALKAIMESGGEYVLLDIRTFPEMDEHGWINGRTLIPHGMVIFKAREIIPDASVRIVVYCKKGKRSALVAADLRNMGYQNVTYLDGGIMTWKRKGYPIETRGESRIPTQPVVPPGSSPQGKTAEDILAEASAHVRPVTPGKALGTLQQNQNALLLDVRTQPELANQGEIQGALVLEYGKVPFHIQKHVPDANTPILLLSEKGSRSAIMAKTLTEMGYKNVYYVKGGILAWKEARLAMRM